MRLKIESRRLAGSAITCCAVAVLLTSSIAHANAEPDSNRIPNADPNPGTELTKLKPFLQKYCFECHGSKKQKGDIRLDTLSLDLSRHESLEIWQGVLDQLNLGEMPPKKQPQPTPIEVKPVVETLTRSLAQAYAKASSTGGRTVLRRLNRHELRNTLRDLLYLNGADYRPDASGSRLTDNNGNGSVERTGTDPLRFFPEDEEKDGFFNLGHHLVMSDFLLKLTLEAVEETINQATHLEPKPNVQTRVIAGHLVKRRANGEHLIETVSREFNADYDMMATGYLRYGRLTPTELNRGVGVAARYRITVEASAHNPQHPWTDLLQLDPVEPFQLCLNIADMANGGISGPSSTPLSLWSLPGDSKKRLYMHEVWMDKTWTPWLGWENGPVGKGGEAPGRDLRSEIVLAKHNPTLLTQRPDKKTDKAGYDKWPLDMARALFKNGYQGPHIRIHSLRVEPLIDSWPPQSHTALYGNGSSKAAEIRQRMTAFAERAFRRPVKPEEVEPFVQLVLRQLKGPEVMALGAIKDLSFSVYEGKWSKLPDFKKLKPVATGTLPQGFIDLNVAKREQHFGVVFEGKVNAPRKGAYLFEMASDDGGRLLVNGKKVVEHDGLHGAQLKKGKVQLDVGEHAIRVEYFAFGAPNSFRAGWRGPDMEHARLSVESLHQSPNNKPDAGLPPLVRAMQDGYAAMLCSPHFLYLKEKPGRLNAHALAARLSYFLWSSMPDDMLFALAKSGKLGDPAELDRQVERMLKDPKAAAFVRHFPSVWLRLDKLGKMPPSGGDFQFYKNLKVEPMLLKQVTTYFGDVLNTNGRIEQFIDSDYTYMNQTLAKWIYKRTGIRGERLRKVALGDRRRGGIFTLPGVMTATANGVDTSPVIRGVWVLENVLGTPPAPPPPDVEPLPTDTREAKTIRQQLALHRKHEACNSCHRKIDPMGFPFENFDVVGRWRTNYKGVREPIDTQTTLSNGTQIADIVAFKQMLMSRKRQVTRSLAAKLLTYASGRELEPNDRGTINAIVEELEANNGGLRDLVKLVAKSDVFLTK